jgi:hypothetical protein
MGFSIPLWLFLLPAIAVLYFLFKPKDESISTVALNEEAREDARKKLDELCKSGINTMTIEEIVAATGGTTRGTAAYLIRKELKCANFDGTLSLEEREQARKEEGEIGVLSPKLICPHCQTRNQVYKKIGVERREKTTDTTNLTAAILSGTQTTVRKVTQLHCKNCTTTWDI